MSSRKNLLFFAIISIILPFFYANAGTILDSYKYAWSNNVGYINFANVVIEDSVLSGYAWSENAGWIKFNPALGGVLNDGVGNLSGSAWGEGLGWIDFSNVNIGTNGEFSGTASGEKVGTISFDCPNYCDVRTDWSANPTPTPTITPTPLSGSGSSSSGSSSSGSGSRSSATSSVISSLVYTQDKYIESKNNYLAIQPFQAGKLVYDTTSGQVILDVPDANVKTKSAFFVVEVQSEKIDSRLIREDKQLINGVFYEIYALNEKNEYITNFDKPLKITLPIKPSQQNLPNLQVYWLNETNKNWVLIPDAIFSKESVSFTVNHLTKFAIFSSLEDGSPTIRIGNEEDTVNEKGKSFSLPISVVLAIAFVVIVLLLVVIGKRKVVR